MNAVTWQFHLFFFFFASCCALLIHSASLQTKFFRVKWRSIRWQARRHDKRKIENKSEILNKKSNEDILDKMSVKKKGGHRRRRQKDRQTDRQTDRETDREIDTDRLIDYKWDYVGSNIQYFFDCVGLMAHQPLLFI